MSELPLNNPESNDFRLNLMRELHSLFNRTQNSQMPSPSTTSALPMPSNLNPPPETPMNGTSLILGSLRDEMLRELERLRDIMGHNDIKESPKYKNLSEQERKTLDKFLQYYSTCPVCRGENHANYLMRFYFDKDFERINLRNKLLKLMEEADDITDDFINEINIGIPCCQC